MSLLEDFSFFFGIKMPVKAYREYINRRPFEAISSSGKPVLLVLGKNEGGFDPGIVEKLRYSKGSGDRVKVAVYRNLEPYAGKMKVQKDGSWEFEAEQDILQLVAIWIKEKGKVTAE